MQRFNNILVIADIADSQNAVFARAAHLAVRNRGMLTVASVVESLHDAATRVAARHSAVLCDLKLEGMMVQEERNRLESLVAPLRDAGVRVQVRILTGIPSIEIIREVVQNHHDLVMMMADGDSGLTCALFGSTPIDLMRKCPCPVWIIKPVHSKVYARTLAAVDRRPSDPQRHVLNVKILELAASLTRAEQGELYVLHVWNASRMSSIGNRLSRSDRERMLSDIHHEHMAWLDELLEECSFDSVRHQIHLLEGVASELIPAMARKNRVDVIVMGTVCRTGVAGFFLGNTAEKVLRRVDCSVMTVKPDSFVTPVRLDEVAPTQAA